MHQRTLEVNYTGVQKSFDIESRHPLPHLREFTIAL